MLNRLLYAIGNPITDEVLELILTEDYPNNPFEVVTVAEKLGLRAIVEAMMRAQLGMPLQRPFGSPNVLSPWHKIFLNPRQLHHLPTADLKEIDTETVIGPRAKKPLRLDIPIMITGMSYGGSLSLKLKMAFAKGSAMAGTSTNTGESGLAPETRGLAKYMVGQYNRGHFLRGHEALSRLDAIEVQCGQGAFGGGVESTMPAAGIDDHLRKTMGLKEGEDAVIHARHPGKDTPEAIVNLVNELKSQYDVPVGVKIAASDFIELDLEVIARSRADFIVIDGSEGGTAVAPPTLEDDVGLPTIYGLVRAVDWLNAKGIRERFSVIAAGGLKTPGDFLKAIALGADAVYIGSIAVLAAIHTQIGEVVPKAAPAQMALYTGRYSDKLDVDKAATALSNFLKSCVAEMKLALQAIGRKSTSELTRDDLVTVDKDLAGFAGIRYAGSARK
ncbi:MAG: FMN-binding glutamate synthase family protein [Firmicutes bacterium]|nr:FMN-binding glutamate synthase family protein [Candidatus Fermentithermobacillaceae bacterium]